MILVLRSQAGTSRRLEGEFRREMKVLREEFKELRRDMDRRFAEVPPYRRSRQVNDGGQSESRIFSGIHP